MKEIFKRFLCYVLSVIFLITNLFSSIEGSAKGTISDENSYATSYRHYNEDGSVIDIVRIKTDSELIIKNFNDGVLVEQSKVKLGEDIIYNERFDLDFSNKMKESEMTKLNEYTVIVSHLKRSNETVSQIQAKYPQMDIEKMEIKNDAIMKAATTNDVGAPENNDGLSSSGYNDGFYYLRNGTISTNPNLVGKLYRKYTLKEKGLEERRTWNKGSAISTIISALDLRFNVGSKASNIALKIFQFVNNLLAVTQVTEEYYFHTDYRYKVRVGSPVYFATDRQKYYWRVYNATTKKEEWIENNAARDGFLDSDFNMIKLGIEECALGKPILTYQTHIQNIGWQDIRSEGDLSGTSGKSLRLEGIKIYLNSNKFGGTIEYRTHVQNEGWKNWVANGSLSGTQGKGLRLEAIQIRLTGGVAQKYRLRYRVHIQNQGWQDWKYDSETAGTSGKNLRLEGIEIRMIRKAG